MALPGRLPIRHMQPPGLRALRQVSSCSYNDTGSMGGAQVRFWKTDWRMGSSIHLSEHRVKGSDVPTHRPVRRILPADNLTM